jgi:hypothetical protein
VFTAEQDGSGEQDSRNKESEPGRSGCACSHGWMVDRGRTKSRGISRRYVDKDRQLAYALRL